MKFAIEISVEFDLDVRDEKTARNVAIEVIGDIDKRLGTYNADDPYIELVDVYEKVGEDQ